MKAIAKRSPDKDDIALMDVAIPPIDEHEILVRVHAIGVGIHDGYFHAADVSYPYVIGIEAAGVVEKIGSAVSNVAIGERITFISAMQPKGGTWAEYAVVADDSLMVAIPASMSFSDAAAIPIAGNTALRAFHLLSLKPGDSLFIAGASGAIGTFAIQMAVDQGYRVVASASKANHDYMTSLGTQKTVDYHDPDWAAQVREWMPGGVDAAIAIQPGTGATSMEAVRDGGQVVTISGDEVTPGHGIRVEQIAHDADIKDELTDLVKSVATGRTRLVIEKVYPFEDALEALRKTTTRHARGKLVITLE